LKFSLLPSGINGWRVRRTSPPVQPGTGVAVSIGTVSTSAILMTRI
jgi:hypothetical protein